MHERSNCQLVTLPAQSVHFGAVLSAATPVLFPTLAIVFPAMVYVLSVAHVLATPTAALHHLLESFADIPYLQLGWRFSYFCCSGFCLNLCGM